MSQRHLFQSTEGLVNKGLRGLVAYNHSLSLDQTNRVVYDTRYDRSKVVLISGGGSGHEPAWSGYVGTNMLAASVAGDVFASPSAKQILSAINTVPSDAGVILVITNYTGDCLHFGLASEKAMAQGHKCRMVTCGDDVSVERRHNLVGRRGLAGQIAVLKVMGGAAGAGGTLDAVYGLGAAFSQQLVSIAATLDHCHVPGRIDPSTLDENTVEIGTGPHNEPGYQKVSPAPSAEQLVSQLLKYCLDENDAERGYVKFRTGDETFLVVNNFGGMSQLELSALVDEVLSQLARDWHMEPVRVYAGTLESSLNAPAFSISIVNVTAAAENCEYSVEQIKFFADVKTDTFWEAAAGSQSQRNRREQQFAEPSSVLGTGRTTNQGFDIVVDASILERTLRSACNALISAEPDITKWDTVMGDGDCGLTLETGAKALLAALDTAGFASNGSVVAVLREVEDITESKMGGTLGGILSIFFVALRNAVEHDTSLNREENVSKLWGQILSKALDHLRRYTPAKVGDRTVMDALIPFAEAMNSGAVEDALRAAISGAEATKSMEPRLGRATYVGVSKEGNGELPPDPGAWGAMVFIRGLLDDVY